MRRAKANRACRDLRMLLSDARIDTDGIENIDDLAYDKIDELSREESRRIRNQNTPSVGEPEHE